MWVAEQSTQSDGRIFERVLRAPGSRILIVKNGKLLLTREKRGELDGAVDYRLPGGKVFDTNEAFQAYVESSKDIVDASRDSISKEAVEEAGIIVESSKLSYLGVDVLGATVSWDLHYWLATEFEMHEAGAQFHESEADEIEGSIWLALGEVATLVLNQKQFSESRSAMMITRYINGSLGV